MAQLEQGVRSIAPLEATGTVYWLMLTRHVSSCSLLFSSLKWGKTLAVSASQAVGGRSNSVSYLGFVPSLCRAPGGPDSCLSLTMVHEEGGALSLLPPPRWWLRRREAQWALPRALEGYGVGRGSGSVGLSHLDCFSEGE